MKKHKRYSDETQAEALRRAASRPAGQTLESVAAACGVNLGTLKGWIKFANKAEARTGANQAAESFTPAQQLKALEDTAHLTEAEVSVWCRERGLYPHHLQAWRQSLTAPRSEESHALREVRRERDRLLSELNRKEKALAEAAALLVLQKKFHSMLSGEGS